MPLLDLEMMTAGLSTTWSGVPAGLGPLAGVGEHPGAVGPGGCRAQLCGRDRLHEQRGQRCPARLERPYAQLRIRLDAGGEFRAVRRLVLVPQRNPRQPSAARARTSPPDRPP